MWWLVSFIVQAIAMGFDEIWFHQKRGLPLWEKIGHPIDTCTVLACIAYTFWTPYSKKTVFPFAILALVSCLMITKDEFIHQELCSAGEQWLHSLLFLVHPVILLSIAFLWIKEERRSLMAVFCGICLFLLYQIVYWNIIHD